MTQPPSTGSSQDPSQDSPPSTKHQKTYRLKMMALVRIMAEVAALIIIALLPVIFLFMGVFHILPLTWKIAFGVMSAAALAIVPFYGFVTWEVRTDEEGLTAVTAFKRKTIAWSDVRALVKRSTWNFPRYVVEAASGEISFPVLLNSLNELLGKIKEHLPAGSASFNPYRKFKQEALLLGVHMAQSAAGVFFLSVLWFFYVASLKKANQADSVIVLVFCIVATAILLWRTSMILLMPLSIEVKLEFVVIRTCFFTVALPWEKIVSVKPAMPLLPEGYIIKTHKGSYLVGNGMDRSDELEQALSEKLTERQELAQADAATQEEKPSKN